MAQKIDRTKKNLLAKLKIGFWDKLGILWRIDEEPLEWCISNHFPNQIFYSNLMRERKREDWIWFNKLIQENVNNLKWVFGIRWKFLKKDLMKNLGVVHIKSLLFFCVKYNKSNHSLNQISSHKSNQHNKKCTKKQRETFEAEWGHLLHKLCPFVASSPSQSLWPFSTKIARSEMKLPVQLKNHFKNTSILREIEE